MTIYINSEIKITEIQKYKLKKCGYTNYRITEMHMSHVTYHISHVTCDM